MEGNLLECKYYEIFQNLKYIKIIDELKIKFKDFSDNEILIEDIYNLALHIKFDFRLF